MPRRQASASPMRVSRATKTAASATPKAKAPLGAPVLMERPKLLLTMEEAADELGVSLRFFSTERDAGNIPAIQIGKRWLVPYASLVSYVRRLCAEQRVPLDDASLAG